MCHLPSTPLEKLRISQKFTQIKHQIWANTLISPFPATVRLVLHYQVEYCTISRAIASFVVPIVTIRDSNSSRELIPLPYLVHVDELW